MRIAAQRPLNSSVSPQRNVMSIAAAQASKFYAQAAKEKLVFTFTEGDSYLVFPVQGKDVIPFWSSRSRMATVQSAHPKYRNFTVCELPLAEFLAKTLTRLQEDDIHIGVNWSGPRLTGYDISAADLRRNIEHWLGREG